MAELRKLIQASILFKQTGVYSRVAAKQVPELIRQVQEETWTSSFTELIE
jgi:hypothetical protein